MERAKGHTIQVVSPQASATGAADQGVTDLVQDGHTWWVVEPGGDRRQAVVYTAAPLKGVVHPLMRWVREVEEGGVERAEEIHERAVLQELDLQMDRPAEAEEVENIKEQIWLGMEWVASSKRREQPRWIVPPGTGEEHAAHSVMASNSSSAAARKSQVAVAITLQSVNNKEASNANCK